MLAPLFARPPADAAEERRIRRLAGARHAPASWRQRARIVTLSWDGAQVGQIAAQLGCHPRTVYRWLHRFNPGGIEGLGDLPRAGRPRRLGELERGRIIALAHSDPPGRLRRQPDGSLALDHVADQAEAAVAHWMDPGCAGRCRPGPRDHGRPQPGPPGPAGRGSALAAGPLLEHQRRSGLRPKGPPASPAPPAHRRRRR